MTKLVKIARVMVEAFKQSLEELKKYEGGHLEVEVNTVFTIDELPEDIQDKVYSDKYYWNVEFDWWENVYYDASQIGLKITGFDIDRGSYCSIKREWFYEDIVKAILENHGDSCDTYQLALRYQKDLADINAKIIEDNDFEDDIEALNEELIKELEGCYLLMLRNEYEYLTSKEAVFESLRCNECKFTANGKTA